MMGTKVPIFNHKLWKSLFAGPLRIVLMVEREDGTELYRTYPLGSSSQVYAGQEVYLAFEVGLRLNDQFPFDPLKSAGQRAYEQWASVNPGYDTWDELNHDYKARWELVAQAARQ